MTSVDWTFDYEAQPKQATAHTRWAKERLYGGAAGGGKTEWLMAEAVGACLLYGVDVLYLRRSFPMLSQPGGVIERLMAKIPRAVGTYSVSSHTWRFRNGALLQLGYLQADKDITRYMGSEFGVICWDQLEQFTEYQYRRMFHPLRVSATKAPAGFDPYMIATANPGGVGHAWVKERFVDPKPAGVVWQPSPTRDEPDPGTRCFIQATVDDNKYLANTAYRKTLESLPEDDRQALLFGNWDVYAGQRFRAFRRSIHVIDPEEMPIPLGGQVRSIGIDYGLDAPFCCLWGAKFPDGLVVVYREVYQSGLTPNEQAQLILASEARGERLPARPLPGYIDPSTFARDPHNKAPKRADRPPAGSIASHYENTGVSVTKANNDRLLGVATVAEALRVRPDARPRLLIYSTCVNLIRTLPALPRSTTNPEDVDTAAEDHAYDALRYLLLGIGLRPASAPHHGVVRNQPGSIPRTMTGDLLNRQL